MAPGWRIEIGEREIRLLSQWSPAERPAPLLLDFDPDRGHVSLLGLVNKDNSIRLPAVLHVPNQGSLRITAAGKGPATLGYDARRGPTAERDFIKVTFPPASAAQPRLEYRCEATAIYPSLGETNDPRLSGYQRNWLNTIQLNPRLRVWPTTPPATHASSACTSMPTSPGTRRSWPTA